MKLENGNMKEKKEKAFWFTIEHYVHISLKKNSLLLYNTLTGETLEVANQPAVVRLVKRMSGGNNMMVTKLTARDLSDQAVARFVNDTRGYFMSEIFEAVPGSRKPVQLQPEVKIHRDVKHLTSFAERSVGEDMMKYLDEISFYINNRCSLDCSHCRDAHKQFPCCTAGKREKNLDADNIIKLLEAAKTCLLSKVNIMGGNIFSYSQLPKLVDYLKSTQLDADFFIHYKNLPANDKPLELVTSEHFSINLLVPAPIDENSLKQAIHTLRQKNIDFTVSFIVESEDHFGEADAVAQKLEIQHPRFHPFYNGDNKEFFETNVYADKEEITGSGVTMKEIRARSALNPLRFGKITVLSSGKIYASLNRPALGTLGTDSLHDVIYCEMEKGKTWRRTRKNVSPCKSCTFQYLCPPLSAYEEVLKRNNLCHL